MAINKDLKQAIRNKNAAKKEAKNLAKQQNLVYKKQVKEMRPYLNSLKKLDLRSNISTGKKSFITKAWNEYSALTTRGHIIYRPKSKAKLKAAQNYSRHGLNKNAPKFDVAFVPTAISGARVKVNRKNEVTVKNKYVTERAIYFDIEQLVLDPEKEIQRILKENPKDDQFILMAGEYTVNGGLDRGKIREAILKYINRYSPGGDGYKERGPNSRYDKWLLGAIAVKTDNQRDFQFWLKDLKAKSNIQKKAKKKQREYFKRLTKQRGK